MAEQLLQNYSKDLNKGMLLSKRYKIKCRIIFANKDVIEIDPTSIVGLSITHDFMKNFFPFVSLKFRLNVENYYRFVEEFETVSVEMELLSADKDNYNEGQKLYYDRIFKEKFKPLFEGVTPDLKRDLYEHLNNSDIPDNLDLEIISVYLFKERDLDVNKKQFNFIAKDCTPISAISYMLNNTKVENVLISSPDNNEKYRQLICPPLNFKNGVQFIQKYYGVYEYGLRCYMDFNMLYILSKDIHSTVYTKNEFEKVYVYIPRMTTNAMENITGSYEDKDKKRYVLTVSPDVDIESISQTNKEAEMDRIDFTSRKRLDNSVIYDPTADRFTFSNPYDTNNLTEASSSKNIKKKIIYDNTDNPYNEKEYINDFKLSENTVSVGFSNIDISILTPNKKYVLVFEDKKINEEHSGYYRIERLSYNMESNLEVNGDIELKGAILFSRVK